MQQLNLMIGQTKEEIALDFIREHEPEEGYFLGFSGGKDSVVLYSLTVKSGVKFKAYYSLMPDPPELIKFIRKYYPNVIIIKPERNIYQQVETRFPPHRKSRWCCDYIKEKPSTKVPLTYRLLGIRAEESNNRKKQGWINKRTKKRINLHPIFDWLEWEIWDYIDQNKLPYCSLYDEGFSRLGCVICPLRSTKEREHYKVKFPAQHRLFEKACLRWWDKKGFHRHRTRGDVYFFNEFMANWYIGK
uniref:Putative phosphoadenosine phosphosulfate n=2 Tax=viral metagenome TaxID=1070528 RepID=A0A6H1Z728_9ZZZZ